MTISTTPQVDPQSPFHRSLQALLARADAATVPSGMLVTFAAAPFGQGAIRDGAAFADTVDQCQWETIYHELSASRLAHAKADLKPLVIDAPEFGEAAPVAIGLLHLRYQQPSRRLAARVIQAGRDDAEIDVPGGALLDMRTAFAASALLPPKYWGFERQPDVHAGLEVEFHLDPAWVVSDAGDADRIAIDFDDGEGFCDMAVGGRHTVRYEQGGERRIVLRAQYGEASRLASFLFCAEPVTAPEPNFSFTIEAERAHNRLHHICEVVCYLGVGRTQITRPFILAEGFPGGASPADLYKRLNGWNGYSYNPNAQLADQLRREGYDVLLILFGRTFGREALQGNAYAYITALQEIWKRMGAKGEIIAGGGSMGGLIARYATAFAETNSIPVGNVSALITFDSPHLGANVPIGVQGIARYFRDYAGEINALLDSPAARQMLIAQRWTAKEDETDTWRKSDFGDFYNGLRALADQGYPRIARYAVSNGSMYGYTGVKPGERAVLWDPFGVGAEALGAPNGGPKTLVAWAEAGLDYHRYYTKDYFSRDGVAGGTAYFFGQLADRFRERKGKPEVKHSLSCFVPAYSALEYPVADAYAFKPMDMKPERIRFTKWYATQFNSAHATIDSDILNHVSGWFHRPLVERSLAVTWQDARLAAVFDERGNGGHRLEMTARPENGPLLMLRRKGDDDVCMLAFRRGAEYWFVSDVPANRATGSPVLKLLPTTTQAVLLLPVFNAANGTVSFQHPGPRRRPGERLPALTYNTAGTGLDFRLLPEDDENTLFQHFAYQFIGAEEREADFARQDDQG